jgi:predicted permease
MVMLSSLWNDLRYATRSLGRSPGFATAAIVTIALGVGVNAGIFTVLNGILFRDLPAPDAHELVSISQTVEDEQGLVEHDTFSTAEYRAYRDGTRTLSGLVASAGARGETTLGGEVPRKVYGALVSCNSFDVLRQPPVLGRALSAQDCEPGADPVVVLEHELWEGAFAADPGIVGRAIDLNRRPFTVVGVAAEGTGGGGFLRVGYFAPMSAGRLLSPGDSRYEDDSTPWLTLVGRRTEGVGPDQVRAELDVIAAQIDRQRPGRSTTLTIERARPVTVPPGAPGSPAGPAAVVMAAFGLVLLIACANVANLLLARGTARGHEIGMRLSLGATRARIVRQLLTESMVISIAGGLLGSLLALWSFQALVALAVPALLPPGLPITLAWDFSPDERVLWFAAMVTFATGILFGLVPALHVSKPDVLSVVRQDAAGGGNRRGGGRLRGTLVGVQVAMCMTLMIAAGLLLRGLYATYSVDPGFEYRNVASLVLESMFDGYGPEEYEALLQRLTAEVGALPGVEVVARTDRDPLGDDMAMIAIRRPDESEDEARRVQINRVTPDYFSVIGLPIVRGRTFTESEVVGPAAERPVIVTETTARNFWPGGDPIGRTLLLGDETLQVVGVAADAQVTAIGEIDPYYVYAPGGSGALLVRSRIGFAATASGIRGAVRALDPSLVATVLPLEANLGWSRGIAGTVSGLSGGLGVLALVLAAVGIYGVVSYTVARRHREIGIRMALGASSRDVLGLVLRGTMRPVVIGAVIGITAAAAVSGVLSSVLFGVSPADPLGIGGAALFVLAVALAAGLLAAGPAVRTDPARTLRSE